MNTYEDKYLKEKVNKIIAAQKDGKIVIAAYSDGTGLPARDELGQDLTRAPYPYDYAVGKVGYLTYNADLGAYLFTAISGQKLPAGLGNYQPLYLAEAILEVESRILRVQYEETSITFTGIQPWKGLYEILREVNEELVRTEAGVVVWKITPHEDPTKLVDHLYPEGYPTLRNGQAMAPVSGFAYDEDHTLAYIALVGYKTSLESLRVSLLAGKNVQLNQDRSGNTSLTPTDKYEQVWQALPEYTSHQVGLLSRLALPGKWEPDDLWSYLLVFRGTHDPEAELVRLFIERIKEASEIPILDEWAPILWQSARNQLYLSDLITGGDCIRGVRIQLQSDWKGLLTELLAEEEISLTI